MRLFQHALKKADWGVASAAVPPAPPMVEPKRQVLN
jgi:hypothetical protein